MTSDSLLDPALSKALSGLRGSNEPYAVATIIRTAGATAAKPGAKALLRADGTILLGWLGGGCTRGAVRKAAQEAFLDGAPRLVSIAPEELLAEKGLQAGAMVDGVQIARNGCPSKGSIEVFIEPCLPQPELVIFGQSPVAQSLADLAPTFDWQTGLVEPDAALETRSPLRRRVIIVATQGHGDLAALKTALAAPCDHVAFVGSRRKYAALKVKLAEAGLARDRIEAVRAPAGLDIGAVTPEEIALSILAELVQVRRRDLRGSGGPEAGQ